MKNTDKTLIVYNAGSVNKAVSSKEMIVRQERYDDVYSPVGTRKQNYASELKIEIYCKSQKRRGFTIIDMNTGDKLTYNGLVGDTYTYYDVLAEFGSKIIKWFGDRGIECQFGNKDDIFYYINLWFLGVDENTISGKVGFNYRIEVETNDPDNTPTDDIVKVMDGNWQLMRNFDLDTNPKNMRVNNTSGFTQIDGNVRNNNFAYAFGLMPKIKPDYYILDNLNFSEWFELDVGDSIDDIVYTNFLEFRSRLNGTLEVDAPNAYLPEIMGKIKVRYFIHGDYTPTFTVTRNNVKTKYSFIKQPISLPKIVDSGDKDYVFVVGNNKYTPLELDNISNYVCIIEVLTGRGEYAKFDISRLFKYSGFEESPELEKKLISNLMIAGLVVTVENTEMIMSAIIGAYVRISESYTLNNEAISNVYYRNLIERISLSSTKKYTCINVPVFKKLLKTPTNDLSLQIASGVPYCGSAKEKTYFFEDCVELDKQSEYYSGRPMYENKATFLKEDYSFEDVLSAIGKTDIAYAYFKHNDLELKNQEYKYNPQSLGYWDIYTIFVMTGNARHIINMLYNPCFDLQWKFFRGDGISSTNIIRKSELIKESELTKSRSYYYVNCIFNNGNISVTSYPQDKTKFVNDQKTSFDVTFDFNMDTSFTNGITKVTPRNEDISYNVEFFNLFLGHGDFKLYHNETEIDFIRPDYEREPKVTFRAELKTPFQHGDRLTWISTDPERPIIYLYRKSQ